MMHLPVSHCKNASPMHTAPARGLALATDGGAPEWVQLLPTGPEITGRDGRAWRMSDPAAVVRATMEAAIAPVLHIDYEHASETRAPAGEPSPAAGWITALEAREDGIWAKVEWTERATTMIAAREYRYLSPVFYFNPQTDEITGLVSAGLTNRPNLPLAALNRSAQQKSTETPMDTKAIAKALGLQPEASADAIETAINALIARTDNPPLDKFVPRADYDALKQRAENAETALNDERATAQEAEIEKAISEAVAAGKIAPATKDYYAKQCRTEGGLERFKEFLAAAPALNVKTDTGLDKRTPGQDATVLTEEEKAVCRNLGIKEEDYVKTKAA